MVLIISALRVVLPRKRHSQLSLSFQATKRLIRRNIRQKCAKTG
jgi:hypothetical protein